MPDPNLDPGEARYALGDPLVDSYLAFVAGWSRPNTLRGDCQTIGVTALA